MWLTEGNVWEAWRWKVSGRVEELGQKTKGKSNITWGRKENSLKQNYNEAKWVSIIGVGENYWWRTSRKKRDENNNKVTLKGRKERHNQIKENKEHSGRWENTSRMELKKYERMFNGKNNETWQRRRWKTEAKGKQRKGGEYNRRGR